MTDTNRGLALTTLIAMLFAAGVAITLAVAAVVLDRALGRQIGEQQDRELLSTVAQVRHLLSERTSLADIAANTHALRDVVIGQGAVSFSLWEHPAKLLFATNIIIPFDADFAINVRATPQLADVRSRKIGGAESWRVVNAFGAIADARGTTVLIALGRRGDGAVSALQARYRATLTPAVAVATLVAAMLGFFVVWRSLRPLTALTTAAAQLTVQALEERLDDRHGTREVRELATVLNALMHRLSESFARLSRFSADLAHDLKTPLATLMMQTQVALSQPRSNEYYRTLLASNAEELEQLSRMIESMLFLARADHAQVAMHVETVDVHHELERIAEYFEGLAEQADVAIIVNGNGSALADLVMLRRAAANLVDNAIRHARRGSAIRLDAMELASTTVIAVMNEGGGIAREDLPLIFDRFYRADTVRNRAPSSVGLGLAIVKSIMDLHGGRVEVFSQPDAATTFRLVFQRANATR